MSDTRTKILDVAELFIRAGGYNNCSFREIAAEIGVKSASVHHHFPTKQDLAVAVARRYAENFLAALGEPNDQGCTAQTQTKRYCGVFRSAFETSGRACLCGILSGEAALLPEALQKEVTAFIDANVTWLEKALAGVAARPDTQTRQHARLIYAALQGALAVASLKHDCRWLDEVARSIANLSGAGESDRRIVHSH